MNGKGKDDKPGAESSAKPDAKKTAAKNEKTAAKNQPIAGSKRSEICCDTSGITVTF